MRIEASDPSIELVLTAANGMTLGEVPVAFTELFEFFLKSDEDAKAAEDQQRDPPYNPVLAFKEFVISKGMHLPADTHVSDELFGVLLLRVRSAIPTIQKKMLEPELGRPS